MGLSQFEGVQADAEKNDSNYYREEVGDCVDHVKIYIPLDLRLEMSVCYCLNCTQGCLEKLKQCWHDT